MCNVKNGAESFAKKKIACVNSPIKQNNIQNS